jgi:hydrogenase nickel incorporation protein HypB
MEFFDFDLQALRERVQKLNPKAAIIPISAKTGQGIGEWAAWLRAEVKKWNQ